MLTIKVTVQPRPHRLRDGWAQLADVGAMWIELLQENGEVAARQSLTSVEFGTLCFPEGCGNNQRLTKFRALTSDNVVLLEAFVQPPITSGHGITPSLTMGML